MGRTSISRHLKLFRRSITAFNAKNGEKIGGPGKVVELDEALFGKRKNHRGRITRGKWIFGGVERESKDRCFLVPANGIPLLHYGLQLIKTENYTT